MMKLKKIVIIFLTVACAVLVAFGIAACSFYTGIGIPVVEYIGGGMQMSPLEAAGIELKLVKASADMPTAMGEQIEIVATVTGEGTYDASLDWEFEFAYENSWSEDKDVFDYISYTVSSDTHVLTLSCDAPFGDPIYVYAYVREDYSIYGVCQLDYLQRLENIDYLPDCSNNWQDQYVSLMDWTYGVGRFTLGTGTLEPEVMISVEVYDDSGDIYDVKDQYLTIMSGQDFGNDGEGDKIDLVVDYDYTVSYNASGGYYDFYVDVDIEYERRFTELGAQLSDDQIEQVYDLLASTRYLTCLRYVLCLEVCYNNVIYAQILHLDNEIDVDYTGLEPSHTHTIVELPAVAATCTTEGKTAGSYCSDCGETIVAQETIAATGHTAVDIPAVAATCTSSGKTKGSKCSTCNTVLTAQTTVAALGHSYDELYACRRCGASIPTSGTLAFTVSGGYAVVTGIGSYNLNATSGILIIPETLGGAPVRTIQAGAFTSNTQIVGVVIRVHASVQLGIGDAAFAGCNLMSTFKVSGDVVQLAPQALAGCGASASDGLTMYFTTDTTPATLVDATVFNGANIRSIMVQRSVVSAYQQAWSVVAGKITYIA